MRAKVVTVMRWYAQNEVNLEESEQNDWNRDEIDDEIAFAWFTRWPLMSLKAILVSWDLTFLSAKSV